MSEREQPKPFHVTWHLLVPVTLAIVLLLVWTGGALAARPSCGPIAPDPGARSVAELEALLEKVGPPNAFNTAKCVVTPDPHDFAPNTPDAHTAPAGSNAGKYHYTGQDMVSPSHSGIWATIEAGNPPVDLRGLGTDDEFHAGRIIAQGPQPNNYWTEIGWIDKSWASNPVSSPGPGIACVYTSKNPDTSIITFCNSLPLTAGNLYQFIVQQDGAAGANNVGAHIFYGGVWYLLATHTAMRCTNSNGSPNCTYEAMYEVYSEDSDPHEGLGPTNPISFQNINLRVSGNPNVWALWGPNGSTCWNESAPPYEFANSTIWENFEARGTGVWPDPIQTFCNANTP